MNKELEALEDIILYLNANEPKGLYCENIETIQQALQRLEAIENANPSEALKELDGIEYVADVLKVNHKIGSRDIANQEIKEMVDRLNYRIPTIKQALLKAQEPKQYLKWEDLEFSEKIKVLEVKMNNNDYILHYTLDIFGNKCCFLYDSAITHHIDLTRQFFNDLHLEVIE